MKICLLLTSILFFSSPFLLAQNKATLNKKSDIQYYEIEGAKNIYPSVKKYIQYTNMTDGTIRFNSVLTRTTQKTTCRGSEAFLVIQKYQTAEYINLDSSYVDASDLAPIAYFTDITSQKYREAVSFKESEIVNTIKYQDSTDIDIQVPPSGRYYNGVVEDDLISALPISPGAKFKLKAINPGLRYVVYDLTVSVNGKEELDVPGVGPVDCWKLMVSSGGNITTVWYSVKDKVQLRKEFEFGNGNKFVRTMIL